MNKMISVRKALYAEWEIIAGFQKKLALETENITLDASIVSEGVMAVFSDPGRGCYYVAETGRKIIGVLLTTFEWSDWRNGQIVWVQSVYVLPEYRSGGVFSGLFRHIRKIVETSKNYRGIRLYVDKTNKLAIEVYRRLGMSDDHYLLFELIPS